MKVTNVEDYDCAVQEFVANMRRLGADVVSVLLYGSIARGSVVPGESDLLDAQVFLRDEVFQTKERFLNVLETMVESCQRLSRTGIPFHPFLYFSLAEASCSPALYTENWQSEKTSQVLLGEDIRSQIRSRESSQAVAATSFFEGRRILAHPLAVYLNRLDWTPADRRHVVSRLTSLKKHITIQACFALGIPSEAGQAVANLKRALPNLDASVLKRIDSFRNQAEPCEELRNLREILREMLIFIETLHDQIIARKGPIFLKELGIEKSDTLPL